MGTQSDLVDRLHGAMDLGNSQVGSGIVPTPTSISSKRQHVDPILSEEEALRAMRNNILGSKLPTSVYHELTSLHSQLSKDIKELLYNRKALEKLDADLGTLDKGEFPKGFEQFKMKKKPKCLFQKSSHDMTFSFTLPSNTTFYDGLVLLHAWSLRTNFEMFTEARKLEQEELEGSTDYKIFIDKCVAKESSKSEKILDLKLSAWDQ